MGGCRATNVFFADDGTVLLGGDKIWAEWKGVLKVLKVFELKSSSYNNDELCQN
ncbi:Hypothetical protein FKW44_012970 [Caligus rogercresseyi]|uniref:Uncharacterized protein n=1 Tax=Caligus rogercresseyi TaxID=217165 RepID=A0A7T8HKE6_CALRO|nr:Hypothetical protein FKW44_012970 [Caligus rogercresseyi]